ncbi:head closure Hc1 [Mycobacterium phage MyraDee]|uniref:Head-to-tail stopper n=1 Tax=Mycobacterium phage MyraDee TaxID=2024303 RepID=A0A222Z0P2_9CAUD|nr:head closure Hc1 [Mycobacterium phage MyraDee]ASR77125.1 head-to-tail stopper [Mycobacterium phage MyraDee]
MSLLDDGALYEPIVIYPQEVVTDIDGNTRTRPSKTGIPAKARFQVLGQSGTSSRRQEQDNEGFESERVYTMRLPRSWTAVLGMQSQIEWGTDTEGNPLRWALFGDVNHYKSSRRTRHMTYTVKRY